MLSRLANLYSGRFHAFAWLALSYFPPAWQTSGIADASAKSTQFGYWEYLSRDDAYVMTEKNVSLCVHLGKRLRADLILYPGAVQLDSFLLLAYPETPDHWHNSLAPLGKTQVWIEANRQTGLPEWLPQEVSKPAAAREWSFDGRWSLGVRCHARDTSEGGTQVVSELLQSHGQRCEYPRREERVPLSALTV